EELELQEDTGAGSDRRFDLAPPPFPDRGLADSLAEARAGLADLFEVGKGRQIRWHRRRGLRERAHGGEIYQSATRPALVRISIRSYSAAIGRDRPLSTAIHGSRGPPSTFHEDPYPARRRLLRAGDPAAHRHRPLLLR